MSPGDASNSSPGDASNASPPPFLLDVAEGQGHGGGMGGRVVIWCASGGGSNQRRVQEVGRPWVGGLEVIQSALPNYRRTWRMKQANGGKKKIRRGSLCEREGGGGCDILCWLK